MLNSIPERDGNEWEKRVKVWLRIRYSNGHFEEVPAGHGGDLGIEGFSRDGRAYQCYAPREPLKAGDLYENQRNKMHDDISKFIQNKADLARLFGTLTIESWWFVVPEHKSGKLVQYAAEKSKLVRDAQLSYIKPNFYIHVATGEDFVTEQQLAMRRGIETLRIEETEVALEEISEWADAQDDLIKKLDAKILRYTGPLDPVKLRDIRTDWLRLHICGKNVLANLQKNHPQLWEEVDRCKKFRRRILSTSYSVSTAPPAILQEAIDKIRSCILNKIPNIEELTLDALVHEAVSEWLLECPLDFPNGNTNIQ